jgi:hypothetical protein
MVWKKTRLVKCIQDSVHSLFSWREKEATNRNQVNMEYRGFGKLYMHSAVTVIRVKRERPD